VPAAAGRTERWHMMILKWMVVVVAVGLLLLVVGAQLGLLEGRPRAALGVKDGRLARPSPTPNSVSSQADLWPGHPQRGHAQIAALAIRGDGASTIRRLKEVISAMPGARVVEQRDDYLYAQFRSRWLKFVDDAEFWFDPQAGVVQVRSASRLGRKDFGVNRARIESLRQRLAESP
jgi:uncharacterized protein (DUF1499 family)